MAHQSLRDRQVAALKKILNLNQDVKEDSEQEAAATGQSLSATGPSGDILWKILVFDSMGSDVLSTVLRVSDLRAMYVHSPAALCLFPCSVPANPLAPVGESPCT